MCQRLQLIICIQVWLLLLFTEFGYFRIWKNCCGIRFTRHHCLHGPDFWFIFDFCVVLHVYVKHHTFLALEFMTIFNCHFTQTGIYKLIFQWNYFNSCRYNSGGKKFTEVLSTKHLSVSIDAITIHNHLWQKKTTNVSARR